MIWYRHWLEMRGRLGAIAFVSVLFSVWLGRAINGAPDFEHTGSMFRGLLETPLAQSIGKEDLFVWAAFADKIPILYWAIVVGSVRDTASHYTLTLPRSRSQVIWTRHAASSLTMLFAVALILAGQCAILLFQGRAIPLVPMALSAAFSIPLVMAWTAIMAALTTIMSHVWAVLASFPIYLFSMTLTWDSVTAFPARGEPPWVALVVLPAITAVGLAFSIWEGHRKEY